MSNDSVNTVEDISQIERWMSAGTAAHHLRMSANWVKQLIVRGHLRAISTELGYLIDPASVEAYAREHAITANMQSHRRMVRKRMESTSELTPH